MTALLQTTHISISLDYMFTLQITCHQYFWDIDVDNHIKWMLR